MLKKLNNLKITTRLWFSFGLLILAITGLGLFSIDQMSDLATTTVKMYRHPFTVNATIREMTINLKQMRIHALTTALVTDNTTVDVAIAAINTLKNENHDKLALLKERFLGDLQEVEALVVQSNKLDELREEALKTLKTSNKEQAIHLLLSGDDAKQYEEVAIHLKNITDFSKEKAKAFMENAQLQATSSYLWMSGVIVATIMLAIWMAIIIARAINRPLTQAVAIANAITTGNLNNDIEVTSNNEIGQLQSALSTLQIQLRDRLDDDKRITEEINAVTHAASQGDFAKRINLENKTGTFKILGDSINQVLEVNQLAIKDLMRVFAAMAQGDLTQVITNQYFGELAQLKQDANTTVQRLTEVTEEINVVTHAASQGDFSKRIILENKTGTFRTLGKSINQVLEFNQLAIKDLTRVFSAVAQGDLTQIITNQYSGELAQLKQDANATVAKLTEVTEEINVVTQTASQGDFSKRVNPGNKTGIFKVIAGSINQVLDYNQLAIKDLICIFSAVAQGDLTKTIVTDYSGELARLKHDANATVQKLTEVLTVIGQSAGVVSTAAAEISLGNANLSQRTTQQAASLEETAASMEQMTGTVQQNSESAKQANVLAASARECAEQGNHVVKEAVLAINEISKSSKKITDIISVINEIAFQTNLLALNAAVEAARAGEQGRGFAVVATEVRNLAQRSAAAAKEIKTLIQDSNTKVEEGTRLANQSGQSLAEIVVAVKKVGDIIAEIAAASVEQAMGIEQVNKAIAQMDQMVEQNSALVEQATAASESMREQAQTLKEQVAFFTMNDIEVVSPARPVRNKPRLEPTIPPAKTVVKKQAPRIAPSRKEQGWEDF
jgi:methyl-accepting chemotaxis protein